MQANAKQKRFFWSVMAVLSTMLVILMVTLLSVGCQKKAPTTPPPPPVVNSDVRTRKRSASAAARAADSLNTRNQQTVTTYERALAYYDSIFVDWPK